jgi:regulator of CtrA degradation
MGPIIMSSEESLQTESTIVFGQRLAVSENFRVLFRDGMNLVEETAAYLDGDGRSDARDLPRVVSLTYATESMRLTTRLMQMASWLLLQRAVNEGEMSLEQASQEKTKIRINGIAPNMDGAGWDGLPEALKNLIQRSMRLQDRVQHIDHLIYSSEAQAPQQSSNPVAEALGQLETALSSLKS